MPYTNEVSQWSHSPWMHSWHKSAIQKPNIFIQNKSNKAVSWTCLPLILHSKCHFYNGSANEHTLTFPYKIITTTYFRSGIGWNMQQIHSCNWIDAWSCFTFTEYNNKSVRIMVIPLKIVLVRQIYMVGVNLGYQPIEYNSCWIWLDVCAISIEVNHFKTIRIWND